MLIFVQMKLCIEMLGNHPPLILTSTDFWNTQVHVNVLTSLCCNLQFSQGRASQNKTINDQHLGRPKKKGN